MLKGVTILNSYVNIADKWTLIFEEFGLFIFFIIGIWVAFVETGWKKSIALFYAIICLVIGIAYFQSFPQRTEFEVILDDTVSWNEFTDRYEVVNVKDKIVTVLVKE